MDLKKKRRRSEDSSEDQTISKSSSRSRSNHKRKSKKSKKKHSKSNKSKSKRKRSRSRSRSNRKESKRKAKKRTRSPSSASSSKSNNNSGPTLNQMMEMNKIYNSMMPGMDTRFIPRQIMNPLNNIQPIKPEAFPLKFPLSNSGKLDSTNVADQPADKIVKDQNFLNSDEKLFESIINYEIGLKSVFNNVQISENYAGTTLFKAIKKLVYDSNTIIFDSNNVNKYNLNSIKSNEIINLSIAEIFDKNGYEKCALNIKDTSNIKEQLYNYRNRHKTDELNHS